MDQLSSEVMMLFAGVIILAIFAFIVLIIIQKIFNPKVDHSIEQSSAGIVLEDQDEIERKILLDDKIHTLPSKEHNKSKDLKFN
jgi:cbb3-type cytochrome oxidase subunit 3